MSDDVGGSVVVVTGASHGIGEHVAMGFAARGARLVLAARRAGELERVAVACRRAAADAANRGGVSEGTPAGDRTVIAVPTDVTDPAQCEGLIARAMEAFGSLDTLVNNVGQGMWARVDEVSDLSVFETMLRVNYLSAVHCTVHALPHLKAARGRVVCVCSLAGRTGVPLRSGYAASKHAMAGFFDSLRIELRGTGVSVTLVCPGFVGTGAQGRNLGADGTALGVSPVNAADVMTPAECARITIAAAVGRKREVVIGARGRIGLWLRPFVPGVIDRMTERAMARKK